ncbi:hypothetical protein EV401DRAFT_1915533 [Pisolithus croceorrhizus]|nr:hypothetical protein EV401DRAFT_1915533 [Pisolithus croceorrhizus]
MMFVVDPRPSYEYYYAPYTSPWTRDRYLGAALAQAEAARRAKEARARDRQQRLQRQALLDALRARMPGGYEFDDVGDSYEPPLAYNTPRQGYPWHAPTSYPNWGCRNHYGDPYFAQGTYPQNFAETREREDERDMKESLGCAEPSLPHRRRSTATSPGNPQTPTPGPITIPIEDQGAKGKSKQVGMDVPSPADEPNYTSESGTDSEVERATDPRVIQESISSIAEIEGSFEKLENEFIFPNELDFESSPSAELKLAYTSRNAPVRYYDHALQELLSKLDAVPSYGSAKVREARRAIVTKIERALGKLEEDIEAKKELATWKLSKVANDATVVEEPEGDKVVEGGNVEMDDKMPGSPTELEAGEGEEEGRHTDEMEEDALPTESHDELVMGNAPDADMAEPATTPPHSTSTHETDTMIESVSQGVQTNLTPSVPSPTASDQAGAGFFADGVTVVSSTSEEHVSDTPEPESTESMPTGHSMEVERSSESHLSVEDEVEVDAFLLSQSSSSAPSPTAASSASTNSDMEEEALLVEMPDNEHEQDDDTWVDVEA